MKAWLYILTFLFGCTTNQVEKAMPCKDNELIELERVERFLIDVDTLQYKHFISAVYSNDTTLLYFGLDLGRNAIDIFDLFAGSYLSTLHFSQPYTFRPINVVDFFVLNPDSIFVFSDTSYKLQIVSTKGEFVTEKRLVSDEIAALHGEEIIGIEPLPASIFYDRHNRYLWLPVTQPVREYEPGFFERPFILGYDFNHDKLVGLVGAWPYHFNDNNPSPFAQDCWYQILECPYPHEMMLLFNGSPYLVQYNWYADSIAAYYCIKSNYVPFPLPKFKGDYEAPEDRRNYSLQNGLYLSATGQFGRYRYFPVRHSQPLFNSQGKRHDFYSTGWSVVVLDEQWQKIGEAQFPANIYDIYNLHNTVHGLLVSKENPNNPDNEEDYLEFELYRFNNNLQ